LCCLFRGGPFTNSISAGAVWVFEYNNTYWVQTQSKLVGTTATPYANFGNVVSCDSLGDTLVVAGSQDDYGQGGVWTFI